MSTLTIELSTTVSGDLHEKARRLGVRPEEGGNGTVGVNSGCADSQILHQDEDSTDTLSSGSSPKLRSDTNEDRETT